MRIVLLFAIVLAASPTIVDAQSPSPAGLAPGATAEALKVKLIGFWRPMLDGEKSDAIAENILRYDADGTIYNVMREPLVPGVARARKGTWKTIVEMGKLFVEVEEREKRTRYEVQFAGENQVTMTRSPKRKVLDDRPLTVLRIDSPPEWARVIADTDLKGHR